MFVEQTRGINVLDTKANYFGNNLMSIDIKQRTKKADLNFIN
jgi:hypothetical protein